MDMRNVAPAHSLEHFPPLAIDVRDLRWSFARQTFAGDLPITCDPGASYIFNLVRLAGKAVDSYDRARENFVGYIRDEDVAGFEVNVPVTHFVRTIDGLEDCLNTTHRGYLFAERLRTAEEGLLHAVHEEVKLRLRVVGSLVKRLNDLRDAVEHRDKDLRSGRRPNVDGAFLAFHDAGLLVNGISLSYVELASLVRRLHEVACVVAPANGSRLKPRSTWDAPAS